MNSTINARTTRNGNNPIPKANRKTNAEYMRVRALIDWCIKMGWDARIVNGAQSDWGSGNVAYRAAYSAYRAHIGPHIAGAYSKTVSAYRESCFRAPGRLGYDKNAGRPAHGQPAFHKNPCHPAHGRFALMRVIQRLDITH